MGCLVFLATAKFFYNQQFLDVINLSGADRFLATRARGSYFFQPIPLVLLSIQFIAVSLLLYFAYCYWTDQEISENAPIYGSILLGYALFEIVKIILERIVGYLLNIYKKMRSYFYKKITVKNWIGLFLLAGCFIASFGRSESSLLLYILIGLAAAVYIVYNIWLLSSYSDLILRFPFYFILYFCTLEIAPYYIVYRYVTDL